MQPTTPFNTKSWKNNVAELIGWVAFGLFWYGDRFNALSTTVLMALGITWGGYTIMRLCSLLPWHKGARRGEGIEQQFTQVSVVAIYGFATANLVAVLHVATGIIFLTAVILAAVSAINITLLLIYRRDTSTVPINYYSHRKSAEEES